MKAEDGSNVPANNTQAGMSTNDMTEGHGVNNYARPSGQNVRLAPCMHDLYADLYAAGGTICMPRAFGHLSAQSSA